MTMDYQKDSRLKKFPKTADTPAKINRLKHGKIPVPAALNRNDATLIPNLVALHEQSPWEYQRTIRNIAARTGSVKAQNLHARVMASLNSANATNSNTQQVTDQTIRQNDNDKNQNGNVHIDKITTIKNNNFQRPTQNNIKNDPNYLNAHLFSKNKDKNSNSDKSLSSKHTISKTNKTVVNKHTIDKKLHIGSVTKASKTQKFPKQSKNKLQNINIKSTSTAIRQSRKSKKTNLKRQIPTAGISNIHEAFDAYATIDQTIPLYVKKWHKNLKSQLPEEKNGENRLQKKLNTQLSNFEKTNVQPPFDPPSIHEQDLTNDTEHSIQTSQNALQKTNSTQTAKQQCNLVIQNARRQMSQMTLHVQSAENSIFQNISLPIPNLPENNELMPVTPEMPFQTLAIKKHRIPSTQITENLTPEAWKLFAQSKEAIQATQQIRQKTDAAKKQEEQCKLQALSAQRTYADRYQKACLSAESQIQQTQQDKQTEFSQKNMKSANQSKLNTTHFSKPMTKI